MNRDKLTDKQASVLGYLRHYHSVNGLMPTYQDISKGMGFKSINASVDHCRLIAAKGYIKIIPNIARGIVIL